MGRPIIFVTLTILALTAVAYIGTAAAQGFMAPDTQSRPTIESTAPDARNVRGPRQEYGYGPGATPGRGYGRSTMTRGYGPNSDNRFGPMMRGNSGRGGGRGFGNCGW